MFAKIQGYLAEPLARSSMFKRACHLRRIRSFSNDRRFDVVFVIAVTEINNYIRSTQALLSTIHTIQMHIYIYIWFLFQRNTFHKRIRKSQSSHALKIPTIFHKQSKDLTLTINFFLKIAKQEQLMFSWKGCKGLSKGLRFKSAEWRQKKLWASTYRCQSQRTMGFFARKKLSLMPEDHRIIES